MTSISPANTNLATQFRSPETMLNRRFQSLRPSKAQSETNKLIASMSVRTLVMSSGAAGIYRRALDGNHPTNANGTNATDASSDSPRLFGSSPLTTGTTSGTNNNTSPPASTVTSPKTSAANSNNNNTNFSSATFKAAAHIAFFSTLASLKAYSFDQVHADLLLRNPQAPVLGMGNRDASNPDDGYSQNNNNNNNNVSTSSPVTSSIFQSSASQQQNQIPIIAMQGIPTSLSDEIFVAHLQRRIPNILPRLVVTSIRAIEDLVAACPIPAPSYVKSEIVRRVGLLSGLLSSLRRGKCILKGDEWDVLVCRVLHKLLAAGLVNEATDICVIFRENSKVFPENTSSLKSHLISQLASRSSVVGGAGGDGLASPDHSRTNSGDASQVPMSPQPKYADPASGVSMNAPAQNLPPLAVLLAVAEGMQLPPTKSIPSPPAFFPGTPMAIVSGCTRILQAVEQAMSFPARFTANAGHLAVHEGTWSWIVQAFRETEKELFEINGSLLTGMCCAANVLSHASHAGPQKFAGGVAKVLEAPNAPSNSADVASNLVPTRGLQAVMGRLKKQQDDKMLQQKETSSASAAAATAASVLDLIRDPWYPAEYQLLHIRRSCSYSPSSLLAVHGRRRDAIASSVLLAVTTTKLITCAARLSRGFFANASKIAVFEQKIKVSFLEAICGLAMRLAGLCLTSSNHLVASLAERASGRAVGDARSCWQQNNNNNQNQNFDPSIVSEDSLAVYGSLPLLQLTCHCLIFLGNLPHQPLVTDQIRPFIMSIPQILGLKGLCDESQKLLASTFFFFVRATPLYHPLSLKDPLILSFRVIEMCLKAFINKNEVVKALARLDQRRNFGKLIEGLLTKNQDSACNELGETFCFLKSLPKGETVLRHLPASLSLLSSSSSSSKNINDENENSKNNNSNNSTCPPRLFTEITQPQLAWTAQVVLAHLFHRSDSHNDVPRSTSAIYSSGMDPTTVLIAKKKRRNVCLKKSCLMAPWRVLLPNVENNFGPTLLLQQQQPQSSVNNNSNRGSIPSAYPACGWKDSSEIGNAKDLFWNEDEE